MSTTDFLTEKSVHKALFAEGLRLEKRRGGYMVLDAETRAVIAGGYPVAYSLSLEVAAEYVDWYRSA